MIPQDFIHNLFNRMLIFISISELVQPKNINFFSDVLDCFVSINTSHIKYSEHSKEKQSFININRFRCFLFEISIGKTLSNMF